MLLKDEHGGDLQAKKLKRISRKKMVQDPILSNFFGVIYAEK